MLVEIREDEYVNSESIKECFLIDIDEGFVYVFVLNLVESIANITPSDYKEMLPNLKDPSEISHASVSNYTYKEAYSGLFDSRESAKEWFNSNFIFASYQQKELH